MNYKMQDELVGPCPQDAGRVPAEGMSLAAGPRGGKVLRAACLSSHGFRPQ